MSEANDRNPTVFERIQDVAGETPYPPEAFVFVLDVACQATKSVMRHMDAVELCWHLHDQAMTRFGVAAKSQLELWSIRSCDDFGRIVYALIDAHLMGRTEQDSIDGFHRVFDFEDAFHTLKCSEPAIGRIRWQLSTMFLVVTICAVFFAGLGKGGLAGAVGTAFSAWLALIGIVCLVQGLRFRMRGWIYFLCVGLGLSGFGLAMFLAFIL